MGNFARKNNGIHIECMNNKAGVLLVGCNYNNIVCNFFLYCFLCSRLVKCFTKDGSIGEEYKFFLKFESTIYCVSSDQIAYPMAVAPQDATL